MKTKSKEWLSAISQELIRQGIIADPSKPRALFEDPASPEISIRALVDQVNSLQQQVDLLLKAHSKPRKPATV